MADTQDFHHGWADWDTSVLERFAEHLAQEMADAARAGRHLRADGLAQWREDYRSELYRRHQRAFV